MSQFIIIIAIIMLCYIEFSISDMSSHKNLEANEIIINDKLLLINTFDGSYYGIEKYTGKLRWSILSKVSTTNYNEFYQRDQIFFSSPIDGTIYFYDNNSIKSLKEKIPDIVIQTPYIFKDQFIFLGKKTDKIIEMDPNMGGYNSYTIENTNNNKEFTVNTIKPTCVISFGKQEYRLIIIDFKTKNILSNLSYVEYKFNDRINNFNSNNNQVFNDISLISDISSGVIFALAPLTGEIMWKIQLDSIIIKAFSWSSSIDSLYGFSSLSSLKITFMSSEAIDFFIRNQNKQTEDISFKQLVFIGKSYSNYYAILSYVVNSNLIMYNPDHSLPIDGSTYCYFDSENKQSSCSVLNAVGFYSMEPNYIRLLPSNDSSYEKTMFFSLRDLFQTSLHVVSLVLVFLSIFLLSLFIIYVYLERKFKSIHHTPYVSFNSSPKSSEKHSSLNRSNLSNTVLIDGDLMSVGKITFNINDIIGKGCEGTTVYKGLFERRRVAVKRILSDFCVFADREVELLSHSDHHPNVIRYYCMEADKQFRYLALELCDLTLYQYITDIYEKSSCFDILNILRQAAFGLSHIHSLNIVHRDIKPHNILLKNIHSFAQVFVSDFGLCKMIPNGRSSLSICNGSVGTEGWMAPELFTTDRKITTTCDVFSFGCVIYFCLSGAKHLYGPSNLRQTNILENNYSFEDLGMINEMVSVESVDLVCNMINTNPVLRPSMNEVLKHPLFWHFEQRSTFLQEVSDRIEREQSDSAILNCLHDGDFVNSYIVVRGDWRLHVHPSLLFDLGKRRRYNGHSIRDLLRAIRNKRHHFSEISSNTLQSMNASTPDDVVKHFLDSFPKLTIFVYRALEKYSFSTDPQIKKFY